jgi:hypothetical protein
MGVELCFGSYRPSGGIVGLCELAPSRIGCVAVRSVEDAQWNAETGMSL